jgi:uncharacterized iron-regulated membrane protein
MLKIHRQLAIPLGVLVSLLCLTGAVLVFQDEILHLMNSGWYHIEVTEGMKYLSDEQLLAKVQAQMPEGLTLMNIEVSDDPSAPATAMVPELGHVDFLINPYTGEVWGKPKGTDFFVWVKQLHRFLLNVPENYQGGSPSVGRVIIGITAICMSLILLTGIFLWWPRNKKMLKNRLTVSTSKGFRRFVYDSHVSLGIYVVIFLLLMSLTGPAWSFRWYNDAAQTVLGQTEQRMEGGQHGGQMMGKPGGQKPDGMRPDGNQPKGGLMMNMGGKPEIRHKSVQENQGAEPANFHFLLQSLHFGKWGGMFTRILYLLAALIGMLLPWSGYYMWWKRTRAIKTKK